MENSLSLFIESWPLFRESVLAGVVAGGLLGFLGVYIVARRMVFLSAAISQTAGLGVTLAFFVQIELGVHGIVSPTVGATLVSLVAVFALMLDRSSNAARRDAILGWTFLVGAAGTLALGTRIVQEVQDIDSILFGTAVAVLPEDFTELLVVAIGLGAIHVVWRRGFTAVALDRDDAKVRAMPVVLLETALLVSLAVAISVVTRILGALPAFAFSVLPAMAALRVASNVPRSMAIAAALGASSGFVGYVVAYLWDLPVGASQALVGAGFVAIFAGLGKLLRRL